MYFGYIIPNPLKKKKQTNNQTNKQYSRSPKREQKQNTHNTHAVQNFPKFTSLFLLHGTRRILRRTHLLILPRTRFGAPNCSWRTPDPNTSSQSRRLRTRRPHGFESWNTTKTPSSPSFRGNNLVLFFFLFR